MAQQDSQPDREPVVFRGPGQWRSQAVKAQAASPAYQDEDTAEPASPPPASEAGA